MKNTHLMSLVRAEDVMVAPAVVSANATLEEATHRLADSAADALLVLGAKGRVAGLLRMRDLVMGAQAVAEGEVDHAGFFASRRFVRAAPDESLHTVLRRMVRRHTQYAVVEEDGSPVGLVSVRLNLRLAETPAPLPPEAETALGA